MPYACHYGHRPTAATSPSATLRGWHYEITIDDTLERMDVRVCFEGGPPAALVPGAAEATPFARDVRRADGKPLPRRDHGYPLRSLAVDACLDYAVDLAALEADEHTDRLVDRVGRSVLLRAEAWLWRPDVLPVGATATLRFSLPEGMQASVPWPVHDATERGGATYRLDSTAFDWLAFVVLGDVAIDRFEHAGAKVELVTLDAHLMCPPAGLRAWAEDGMDTVALLYEGHFPREHLQLVVRPVGNAEEAPVTDHAGPVYFGTAARGGGAGVQIFLDDGASAEGLLGNWTTAHELLHHGMPFIEDTWLAEGLVSYYTELMRTRAGHRTELGGWQALLDAFERGRHEATGMTLAETSATIHQNRAHQRVYWGGAAIALLADVEMRLESNGARSLDDAMRELRRCCGDADHQWKAQALLEHLDAWYGRPLFNETAKAALARHELPDVEAALARIGVTMDDTGKVQLDEEHPAADLRRAIMAPLP